MLGGHTAIKLEWNRGMSSCRCVWCIGTGAQFLHEAVRAGLTFKVLFKYWLQEGYKMKSQKAC